MIYKIEGQQPFQVLSDNFSISPATEAYILQVSADGENYTDLFAVAAGVTRMITGVAAGSFYRLKNNVGEVSINWRKDCSAGDGFAYELKPSADLPLVADEGTFAVTIDGIYQFKNGEWVEAGGSVDPEKVREIVQEEIQPVEARVEVLEGKVEELDEIDKRIDEVEETTSIALNNLNSRVNEKTTEQWVKDQHYLTEHQDISGKADKTYVDGEIEKVEGKIPSLDDYATKEYVDSLIGEINNRLTNI